MYFIYLAVLVAFIIVLFTISSRVRKAAREAFEAETVETDELTIIKPEGFISPLSEESEYAFEAYSKDFGAGDAGGLRQAQALVSVFPGKNLDEICAAAKKEAGEILSEEAGAGICRIKGKETLKNAAAYNFYKIARSEDKQKVYRLKVSVLEESLSDYQDRVDEMLESFRLK